VIEQLIPPDQARRREARDHNMSSTSFNEPCGDKVVRTNGSGTRMAPERLRTQAARPALKVSVKRLERIGRNLLLAIGLAANASLASVCRPYQEGYLRQRFVSSCSGLSFKLLESALTSRLPLKCRSPDGMRCTLQVIDVLKAQIKSSGPRTSAAALNRGRVH
jgi:hypothetical protein